jgi:hypothetical protein
MKTIKINEDVYEYLDAQCQLTFGTHADIYLTFDVLKYPGYKSKIISLFESDKAFSLLTTKFVSKSNLIKLMDIDTNRITLTIRAEILETISQDERREEIINDLLDNSNQTFSI